MTHARPDQTRPATALGPRIYDLVAADHMRMSDQSIVEVEQTLAAIPSGAEVIGRIDNIFVRRMLALAFWYRSYAMETAEAVEHGPLTAQEALKLRREGFWRSRLADFAACLFWNQTRLDIGDPAMDPDRTIAVCSGWTVVMLARVAPLDELARELEGEFDDGLLFVGAGPKKKETLH